MAIIPRANPGQFQTELGGIGARNEARVSYAGANAIGEATSALTKGLVAGAEYAEKEAQKADIAGFQEAQRKVDAWEETQNDPNNPKGFYSFKGRDALGLKDTLLPDFDKTISEVGATLSPRAQEKFKQYADGRRHAIATSANSYATREYDGWRKANSQAWEVGQRTNIDRAYQSGNEDEAVKLLGGALETMAAESIAEGRPMAELTVRQAAFTSDVHASILEGMLVSDPIKAREYLETHGDELLPDVRTKAEEKVRVYADDAVAEQIAEEAFSGQATVTMNRGDHANVQTKLGALGDQHGFRTTDVDRTPAENAKVGGVKNSQHLTGTARDYSVKGKTPAQVAAFAEALKAEGFEVITKDHGTAPHIHAELPGNQKAVQRKPPATLGEAIAAARSDPRLDTPQQRKAAEAKVRSRWQVMEADKLDQRRAADETANIAIETGDPNLPLRQLLGDNYLTMAAQGKIPALENRLAERRRGVVMPSNPVVISGMEQTIHLAALGVPEAVETLRAVNPFAPELQLAMSDRTRLAEAQRKALSADPAERGKAVTEGEVTGLIVQYRRDVLGLTDAVIKKSDEKMTEAGQFDQAMRTWRSEFNTANGRQPTYIEVRKQADAVALSRLTYQKPVVKDWWPDGKETKTIADLGIPAADLADIAEALRAQGKPATVENIRKMFSAGAASGGGK